MFTQNQQPQPTIVMTPPQDETGRSSHPRRLPAHKSVSLLHSPRQPPHRAAPRNRHSDTSSSDSNRAQARLDFNGKRDSDSPSSLNPTAGKHSSRESSNAEKWFEKSNNEVRENSASYADNDPPFFMRHSSSSEEQGDAHGIAQGYPANDRSGSLQMRAGLLHLGTDGSSTEDYRSVIDDLTIENKKLKRRLKKYERLHDSHLKDEKLFEVRIHGLPPDKKRELEETLRKFTTDLHSRSGSGFPANGYVGLGPLLPIHKTASSSMSQPNTDSAYASMSGRGSSASDSRHPPFAQSAMSRHANIHTYLHHIPKGLLPDQNPATMSERDKKKLVVRRLEQIFAGKGAAAGEHQQALQQQDVSHMAARADRIANNSQEHQSGKEGIREANIMRKAAEEAAMESAQDQDQDQDVAVAQKKHNEQNASLEQRPTRPLDLDPERAQIPAENLRYIRHLGFTLPEVDGRSPQDDQGWVYLNLLINMAQLHNISVTSDFIRKAVEEFSAKLELASDGRKLRWKGGASVTRTSSHSGDSTLHRTDDDNNQSPRKRIKLSRMNSDRESIRAQRSGMASAARTENSRFAYTPLFFHKDNGIDEDSSSDMDEDDGMSSQFHHPIGGDSSGMTSSGIRTTSTKLKHKKKHEDGPIIFYNNARFCSDLSGDHRPNGDQTRPMYKAASIAPIGKPETKIAEKYYEKRGPLAEAEALPEPMNLVDNPIPESLELSFPPSSSPHSSGSGQERSPINFEVTGIGGVYPADNFSIAVQSRHAIVEQGDAVPKPYRSTILPAKLARILHGDDNAARGSHAVAQKQIIAARRSDLRPSSLPPALNYMQSDSMSDDDSEAVDNMSIAPDSPVIMPRMAPAQQMELPFSNADDSEDAEMDDDEDSGDESDDGSLDLLAAAREIDPEAVRAREREYDANMAERLAEEIPAGSSAATAGGGSGFVSPANGISKAVYQKAKLEARSHRSFLSHPHTSESMKVSIPLSSTMSEDGDGSVSS